MHGVRQTATVLQAPSEFSLQPLIVCHLIHGGHPKEVHVCSTIAWSKSTCPSHSRRLDVWLEQRARCIFWANWSHNLDRPVDHLSSSAWNMMGCALLVATKHQGMEMIFLSSLCFQMLQEWLALTELVNKLLMRSKSDQGMGNYVSINFLSLFQFAM